MEKENSLSQIEQALDLAFGALVAGDAQALAVHAEAVLQGTQALAATAPAASWAGYARRVQLLREAIVRQQAHNELMLHQLVPAFQQPTYSAATASGARPSAAYTGVARASGRLEQVLRA